jgi:hypothetical protein
MFPLDINNVSYLEKTCLVIKWRNKSKMSRKQLEYSCDNVVPFCKEVAGSENIRLDYCMFHQTVYTPNKTEVM